jgi:outer membrane protein TolC
MRRADLGRSSVAFALATVMLTLMTGCVVGPDYVKPTVITPEAYKETDSWKMARPRDDLSRGAWWELFSDPQLNALEAQVDISNQNIALAEAQFRGRRVRWCARPEPATFPR